MEWYVIGVLMFLVLFGLLLAGVPVAFALFSVVIFVAMILWGPSGLLTLAASGFSSLSNYLLLAAPLFIFMGICVEESGLGADAFRAIEIWLGSIRGGLAITTIAVATIFGAATGFSGTGSAAFGPVALPEMARRKYDPGLALGAMGGGSALGVLIPPSVPLLMYGFLSGTSVSMLFYAGLIPGILGGLLFMAYIAVRATLNPKIAPQGRSYKWEQKIAKTWRILPLFLIIAMVLGSLWGGMATPTESAALGSVGAFLMLIFYRRLSWPVFKHVLLRTAEINTMILAIVMGAIVFSQLLSYSGFVTNFSTMINSLTVSPWLILVLMMATNIFLGCFLDTMGILFLTLPIYLPIIEQLGFNPIWFGVLIAINSEIGCLTPPVGINLYILKGVAPEEWSLTAVMRGVAPYWFLYLFLLILVAMVPSIALWLPGLMR